jgi:hypothetical protein
MRLTRVFLDQDLRSGFEGLRKIAKEVETNLEGSVVFINRRMTSFKLLHQDAYLIYYKNGNRRIPIEALRHLPESFGGSELEMKGAIKKSLTDRGLE